MKRRVIIISVALLFIGWGAWWLWTTGDAPRYRKIQEPVKPPPEAKIFLNHGVVRLLNQGKTWLAVFSKPDDQRFYLFDLASRKVEGELIGAIPTLMNADQTSLLCVQHDLEQSTLRDKFSRLLERLSGGKIRIFPPPQTRTGRTRYWALKLARNSAQFLSQADGLMSVRPSPTLRYVHTGLASTNSIFDLQNFRFRTVAWSGQVLGWWSETQLLVKSQIYSGDLLLVDVVNGEKIPLVKWDVLQERLASAGLPEAVLFWIQPVWNEDHYDFYATDTRLKDREKHASLVKITRPEGELQVLARDVAYGARGHVERTGSYYVYCLPNAGRQGPGPSAVILRDLRRDEERTLVSDDGSRNSSMPTFWNDRVLYYQSNALWQVNLDGTEKVQLFP